MKFIKINDCNLHYEITGSGTETFLLAHGLLWSGKSYEKQVVHLKDRYRLVTYDHRGQGQSEVTETGYDMDSLYEDAVALIENLHLGKVHFVGLSMGGFVGMRLAARRPDLVKSLILLDTSAETEPNKLKYNVLTTIVNLFGVKSVASQVMDIMFSDTFLKDSNRKDELAKWIKELQNNPKSIVKAVRGVIDRKPIDNELNKIKCPTLIMVGTEDKATLPARAEYIHSLIPQSELKLIDHGGHMSCIDEPEQVNSNIDSFLAKL